MSAPAACTSAAPLKPDPTVLLRMAASMGVAPQDCAYVGDSDVDMMTARNAGMTAAAHRVETDAGKMQRD